VRDGFLITKVDIPWIGFLKTKTTPLFNTLTFTTPKPANKYHGEIAT
jgi:hypothetical protein